MIILLDKFNEDGGASVFQVINFHLTTEWDIVEKANHLFFSRLDDDVMNFIVFWVQLLVLTKTATLLRKGY